MQQLRQYPGSGPLSSREPRIPNRWLRQGEAENSEISEISETLENIFHQPIPKTENSVLENLGVRSNALRPVYIDQKTSIKVSNYLEHVPVTQFNQLQGEIP